MSPSPSPESILQNLIHADLHFRKKGFQQVKSYWQTGFREYVYTAIESEKNRQFQSEMVEYILGMLKDKSLRKMIRFEENGKLFPKSRQLLVGVYLEYEDHLAREALIKSFKRDHSQINEFVIALINSSELLDLWGNSPTRIYQLLKDCLDPEITDFFRKTIISAFISRYIKQAHFRKRLGTGIWELITSYPILHAYVIDQFFNPAIPLQSGSKAKLSWSNWSWATRGSSILYHHYKSPLSEFDEFLILSASNTSDTILQSVIPVLGKMVVPSPFIQSDGYEEILLSTWSDLIKDNHIMWVVTELDLVTTDTLDLMTDRTGINFHQLDSEINIHDLLHRINGYFPRYLLVELLSHQSSSIRALAYESLSNNSFFFVENTSITPYLSWDKLISLSISNRVREETEVDRLVSFMYLIAPQLFEHQFSEPIKVKFREMQQHIHSLPSLWAISLLCFHHLDTDLPDIPKKGILSQYQIQVILHAYFDNHFPPKLLPVISHLLDQLEYDSMMWLIERIQTSLNQVQNNQLMQLLDRLTKHRDVRIRTRATLVKKNLEIP